MPRPVGTQSAHGGGEMAEPMRRCCQTHENWSELTARLIAALPQVDAVRVADWVLEARQAGEPFGMPEPERLATAEAMRRHALLQLTGELSSNVHFDTQPHVRAPRSAGP